MDGPSRLARAAQGGDDGALAALVETTYDAVWRLCVAMVDKQSGDDLAQETFIRVVRSLPTFSGESSARTWILAIARHTALDELRTRHRRRSRDHALALHAQMKHRVDDPYQLVELTDLVLHLELERRTAFVLTQLADLSYEEAAKVCDCPVGTIRSRVSRARLDLAALMDRSRLDTTIDRSQ